MILSTDCRIGGLQHAGCRLSTCDCECHDREICPECKQGNHSQCLSTERVCECICREMEQVQAAPSTATPLYEIQNDLLHGRHDCALQKMQVLVAALGDQSSAGTAGTPSTAANPTDALEQARVAVEVDQLHTEAMAEYGEVFQRLAQEERRNIVDHPAHYGGADNVYEVIKIIEAHNLNFNLGNATKYILRCEHKGTPLEDLRKGLWYLTREIENRERGNLNV